MHLCQTLYPEGHGSHATPSEVAITQYAYPERHQIRAAGARASPPLAASPTRTITAPNSPMAASAPTPPSPIRRMAKSLSAPPSRA